MPRTIGCIGCGNMGSAILAGFAETLDSGEWHLCAYNRTAEKMKPLEKIGVRAFGGVEQVAAASDILIFAVKPHQLASVLMEAAPHLREGVMALSIAAGFGMARMRNILGDSCRICRCMPTTTAMVGKGIFAFCFGSLNSTQETSDEILRVFGHIGYCLELPEEKFTDFSALIGAGPAYVFAAMHALEQAGVTFGFTRDQSHAMLVELFGGCAELAKKQPKTFMQLRDDVCSPGGLTIAGINVLDRAGYTGLMVEAVSAARERGKDMAE